MKAIVNCNLLSYGSGLHPKGSCIEISDEDYKKLLEKGVIATFEPENPVIDEPPFVEEFTITETVENEFVPAELPPIDDVIPVKKGKKK